MCNYQLLINYKYIIVITGINKLWFFFKHNFPWCVYCDVIWHQAMQLGNTTFPWTSFFSLLDEFPKLKSIDVAREVQGARAQGHLRGRWNDVWKNDTKKMLLLLLLLIADQKGTRLNCVFEIYAYQIQNFLTQRGSAPMYPRQKL